MTIRMNENQADNTFSFDIYRDKKTMLSANKFPSKEACLKSIESILLSLKTNNILNIRSVEGGYLFSIAKIDSIVFKSLEAASDGLAFLKEGVEKEPSIKVAFRTKKQLVVSRKRIGEVDERYDFTQISKTEKSGFELIDKDKDYLYYFHFNDANGKPIIYSRAYDGKKIRLQAALSLIADIKDKKERVEFLSERGGYLFVLKTADNYEIARSRIFKDKGLAHVEFINFKKAASGKNKILKSPKKKNSNKKDNKKKPKKDGKKHKHKQLKEKKQSKQKFSINQQAPLGIIGFEIFRNPKDKAHYFHYHDEQGKALIVSRPFSAREDRKTTLEAVLTASQNKRLYEMKIKGTKHYFILSNAEGQQLARSRYFQSQQEMITGMRHLHANAKKYIDRKNIVTQSINEQISISLTKTDKKVADKTKNEKNTNKKVEVAKSALPSDKIHKSKPTIPNKKEDKPKTLIKRSIKQPNTSTPQSVNKVGNKTTTDLAIKQQRNRKENHKRAANAPASKNSTPEISKTTPSPTTNNSSNKSTPPKTKIPKVRNQNQTTPPKSSNANSNKSKPPIGREERKRRTNRNTNRRKPADQKTIPLKEVPPTEQVSTHVDNPIPYRTKREVIKDAPPRIPPKGDKDMQGTSIVKWLFGFLGLFSLIALVFFLKDCKGKTVPSPISPPVGVVETETVEPIGKRSTLVAPSTNSLGFEQGSLAARMADFLSLSTSEFPRTYFLSKVYFPYGQETFHEEAYGQLDEIVKLLNAYPSVTIQINGHTDNSGTPTDNQALSEKRATLIKDYLVKKGIEAARVAVKGYGATRPVASNETDEGRQSNRRSEIVLLRR